MSEEAFEIRQIRATGIEACLKQDTESTETLRRSKDLTSASNPMLSRGSCLSELLQADLY